MGCKFGTTLSHSPLGPLASECRYKSLVGGFHGHAHCRLCQTTHLTTYVEGVGCEDLEGCERFFAKTNGLARGTRYASAVHRVRRITSYFKMLDECDTYESLSKFLIVLFGNGS